MLELIVAHVGFQCLVSEFVVTADGGLGRHKTDAVEFPCLVRDCRHKSDAVEVQTLGSGVRCHLGQIVEFVITNQLRWKFRRWGHIKEFFVTNQIGWKFRRLVSELVVTWVTLWSFRHKSAAVEVQMLGSHYGEGHKSDAVVVQTLGFGVGRHLGQIAKLFVTNQPRWKFRFLGHLEEIVTNQMRWKFGRLFLEFVVTRAKLRSSLL
jgi:hypothetical protein